MVKPPEEPISQNIIQIIAQLQDVPLGAEQQHITESSLSPSSTTH